MAKSKRKAPRKKPATKEEVTVNEQIETGVNEAPAEEQAPVVEDAAIPADESPETPQPPAAEETASDDVQEEASADLAQAEDAPDTQPEPSPPKPAVLEFLERWVDNWDINSLRFALSEVARRKDPQLYALMHDFFRENKTVITPKTAFTGVIGIKNFGERSSVETVLNIFMDLGAGKKPKADLSKAKALIKDEAMFAWLNKKIKTMR